MKASSARGKSLDWDSKLTIIDAMHAATGIEK